uniref:Uncharacterized protein n=1 Tax=Meloidogyne enterolobii TaxID=390850 RepID=A0A6V7WGM4_MELEN|nr:unnamed protein product [Meloidogyne enterolobii]
MRTPNKLEEWALSTKNSDNNETFREELENFTEKSCLETSSIGDLSTCSSCCLSKNSKIQSLELQMERLTIKIERTNLSLEKSILERETINFKHENEIRNLKQNFQKLNEENNKLKVENDKKDEKINSLEEEIKMITQKISYDNENKVEIKQNSHELIKENNIQLLKIENGERINFLEEEIKKTTDLFDKKIGDLIEFNNLINNVVSLSNCMVFVIIKNKWSELDSVSKCDTVKNCININGFVNIINDENIGLINCLEGKRGSNKTDVFYAEISFKKIQNYSNYSLYYFECLYEGELNNYGKYISIGLENCRTKEWIEFYAECAEEDKLSTPTWKNGDIFGCGLVYPPTFINEFPYVFFTKNGKYIRRVPLVNSNSDLYNPFISVQCCSVKTNFGDDLENKPFKYDISKHLIIKYIY